MYHTIGEVSGLCDVPAHVLRYWEKEFVQLRPSTRRGKRRYYQQKDIDQINQIRSLLYDQGFTIVGARTQLDKLHTQMKGIEKPVVDNNFLKSIYDELTSIRRELQV